MTKLTSHAIRAELAETTLAMNKARDDAALFERLKAAPALATKLAKRADELTGALSNAEADEAKAEREALFAKYVSISVTGKTRDGEQPSAIGTNWTITYVTKRSSMGVTEHVRHVCTSFEALDPYTYN